MTGYCENSTILQQTRSSVHGSYGEIFLCYITVNVNVKENAKAKANYLFPKSLIEFLPVTRSIGFSVLLCFCF